MGGVVGAGAGDDGGLAADLVDDGRAQRELLVVAQRRRLAGRAGEDEPVGAVLDEVRASERAPSRSSDAVGGERGDHRRDDAPERRSRSGFAAHELRF